MRDLLSTKERLLPNSLIAQVEPIYKLSARHLLWPRTCNRHSRSMDQISAIAASGLRARMESLDMLANNIANSSTSGYKGDGEFYTLFTSEAAAREDPSSPAATMPMIKRPWTDFSQGLLEPTNNPLDFGISGKGFFGVQGPSGPLYTRNGNFQMAANGTLVTSEGYALLDNKGKPIKGDPSQPIELTLDGNVQQQGQLIGKLKLVDFKDTSALTKQGNNYFTNTGDVPPADAVDVQVHQGKIEASNVSASQMAVRLVSVTRQFEMMQKAISISGDMNRQAIEEVAKV
jgi:flagellar basal-body rod protein FlgF